MGVGTEESMAVLRRSRTLAMTMNSRSLGHLIELFHVVDEPHV